MRPALIAVLLALPAPAAACPAAYVPPLRSTLPADGALDVAVGARVVVIHEGYCSPGSPTVELRRADGTIVTATRREDRMRRWSVRVTLVPESPLEPGTVYEIWDDVDLESYCGRHAPVRVATFTTGAAIDATVPELTPLASHEAWPYLDTCEIPAVPGPRSGFFVEWRWSAASEPVQYAVYEDEQLLAAVVRPSITGGIACENGGDYDHHLLGRGPFVVRAADASGNESSASLVLDFDEPCPRPVPPPSDGGAADAASDAVAAGAAPPRAGCAIAGGRSSDAIVIVLAALAALAAIARRRRRA